MTSNPMNQIYLDFLLPSHNGLFERKHSILSILNKNIPYKQANVCPHPQAGHP